MKKTLIKILTSVALFLIALFVPFKNVWINNCIYIVSYLIVGLEVVIEAVENI